MVILAEIGSTFAAAAVASTLYLVQRQRPRHRPFGRHGWRYTLSAIALIAGVTTGVAYLAARLTGSAIPPQVLAFVGPIGMGGVRMLAQRGASGEPNTVNQWLALGLPLVLQWVEDNLADLKQERIDQWRPSLEATFAVHKLINELRSRLADRGLPGTTRLLKRLDDRANAYEIALDTWADSRGNGRSLARVELDGTISDLLRLVYEVRADQLVRNLGPTSTGPGRNGQGVVSTRGA